MGRGRARVRERSETLRHRLQRELESGPQTVRDLSVRVRIPEKEVISHLEHVQRSLRRSPQRLHVDPAECLQCGFRYQKRERLTSPSTCPRCRSQRIAPPLFRVEARSQREP
jgi:predicted Zn-ribbon and HTH transcriptional regulator